MADGPILVLRRHHVAAVLRRPTSFTQLARTLSVVLSLLRDLRFGPGGGFPIQGSAEKPDTTNLRTLVGDLTESWQVGALPARLPHYCGFVLTATPDPALPGIERGTLCILPCGIRSNSMHWTWMEVTASRDWASPRATQMAEHIPYLAFPLLSTCRPTPRRSHQTFRSGKRAPRTPPRTPSGHRPARRFFFEPRLVSQQLRGLALLGCRPAPARVAPRTRCSAPYATAQGACQVGLELRRSST